ncbi:hypothetical protein Fcan01_18106 [Folsomia candida]|uniref:Uncharacterized protein n=1 Tax=Folsomia candida TaxID=158441 RepID=A0A226DP70_FOLCA|nr:hypothetical protein Fcan01_18106 [Folsomia candida]
MTTRRQFTDNIGIHPEMIFELANFFFWGSYTFLVANTVWFKKHQVKDVLQLPMQPLRLKARILTITLSLLVPTITILDYLQFTFFDENLNPVPVMDNFMEKLAKTFGTNNSTIYNFSETCWGTKVIVGIAFIIDFNWYFLSILGEVFVLISAVAAYEVVHRVKLSNEGSVQATHIQRYVVMKEVKNIKFHGASSIGNSLVYVKVFMKNSPGQDGLTGGKFFLLSYGFLGTTATIFLTYVLVMIQFKAAAPSCGP